MAKIAVAKCVTCETEYKAEKEETFVKTMREAGWRTRQLPAALGLHQFASVCPAHVMQGDF